MFLGTLTLKPDREATLSSLLLARSLSGLGLVPPSPPRSAGATQL